MNDAELHVALREVVAIGRRGGYDGDEVAEKLAGVVRDYAAHQLRHAADDSAHTGFTDWLNMRADALTAGGSSPAIESDGGPEPVVGTMTPLICCDERHQQKIEALTQQLRHERQIRQDREEELRRIDSAVNSYGGPPLTGFIDARALEEAKKAARDDREQIKHLGEKLDIAERALRGLGLVFG